jgi:N-acetylmuramoyl-L-alanine amidase
MRRINKIIVHCTASEDSLDIGFREIDEWHRQRGWLSDSGISCGYHWIVRRDGRVERGRPEVERGAHAGYEVNKHSIGVVWVGTNKIGFNQRKQLLRVLRGLINTYDLEETDVLGHNELPDVKKGCPVINMDLLRADLLFEQGEDV